MNLWDVIIIVLIALLVFGAVFLIKRGKRNGCSCGCEGCSRSCENRKEKDI